MNIQEQNSQLIDDFIFQLKKAENTKASYKRDLELFNRYLSKTNISINELNNNTVQMFIDALEQGSIRNKDGKKYSPSTINRIYAAIRTFCNYTNQHDAVKDIDINQTEHISKLSPKSIETDEIETIRLRISNSRKPSAQRDLAIFDMLYLTGVRVSELVNLTKDDLEYDEIEKVYRVHVRDSKNKKARSIPIQKDKFKYIKRYLDSRRDNVPYVFISQRQKQLTTRSIQMMLKEYGITPHMLRHTFCTRLARSNQYDLSMIASLAGHSITVAQRYTTPTEKQKAEAIAKAFSLD
ncbi:tyrosine-type recombinase/integrase [Saccharococcus thermophilus]|uniref:Site-specific recombinase XerD n=1 Tax=Saccharococcus thermophilus TaxID=29396 RepID=A0A846MI87_9BACL|nr:tyrosine-type recombinase/integrase [Saccharococcus thermophilus]NIK15304.1 site-specific recombinase XerD [Saccharococcus thermophilus]